LELEMALVCELKHSINNLFTRGYALLRSSETKATDKTTRGTGSGGCTSVLSEEQTLRPFVAEWQVFVVIDGVAYKRVWVLGRILKEFVRYI
jgi:hypothetical protein